MHDHSHCDHHAPASFGAAFAVGVILNGGFVVAEVVFGFKSGSLALVADAGHNLGDVLGLLMAWAAVYLGTRPPTLRRTYGLRRSSILAALFNATLLLVTIGGIAWEAVTRLAHPGPVAGNVVMIVAGVGIAINGGTALMFVRGRAHDINIDGAYQHMAADALVALGVVVVGFAIKSTGLLWLDPAASLAIVLAIGLGTWRLLRRAVDLALDAVPEGIDPAQVHAYLASLPGVVDVTDLHIWAMSTTETALTAHLVCPSGADDQFLCDAIENLRAKFHIDHPTLQVERGALNLSCSLGP